MPARMRRSRSLTGGTSRRGANSFCLIRGIKANINVSQGPVVEQGTHFCDLSRYFGGDVDLSTVQAHSLEWDEEAGHLRKQTIDESQIAPENRIPRVTSATWYACCCLVNSAVLDQSLFFQEIRERCGWDIHSRRRTPGQELQLRARSVR